ncbi:MAG: hypothetical protein ACK5LZ_01625 [Anaerorhabdus sp.]
MKKYVYCQDRTRKKFFRKVTLRNFKLIKISFFHLGHQLRYYFGKLNYIELNQKYWEYIDIINLAEEVNKEEKWLLKIRDIIETDADKNTMLLPRKMLNLLGVSEEIISLDELDGKHWIKSDELKESTLVQGENTALAMKVKKHAETKRRLSRPIRLVLMLLGLLVLSVLPMTVSFLYSAALSHRAIVSHLFTYGNIILVTIIPIFLWLCFLYFIFK